MECRPKPPWQKLIDEGPLTGQDFCVEGHTQPSSHQSVSSPFYFINLKFQQYVLAIVGERKCRTLIPPVSILTASLAKSYVK